MAGVLNQKAAQRLAEELGWRRETGGKHGVKMVKRGFRPVTLPHHGGKDYGKGLSAAIRKQLTNPTKPAS
jgi:predicted RNA binding protein YcfA (HicA-like mRNA interferase family)